MARPDDGLIKRCAQNVLKISDHYAEKGPLRRSIWQNEAWVEAYLSYFLPLNWLRLLSIVDIGAEDDFFSQFDAVIDFGSGPGTFHLAASERNLAFKRWTFIETASNAVRAHKDLNQKLGLDSTKLTWHESITSTQAEALCRQDNTLAVFSYALNELETLPDWAFSADGLLILEPSTRELGRGLQSLRAKLIEKGWSIWAPCTHAEACPLLVHSEKDWCHSRIHIKQPDFVAAIENYLPMRNDTVTYSYLLASRSAKNKKIETPQAARVIGDTLFERGKIRQSICRGPHREFLSWLTRYGEPELIARGSRIEIPATAEIKGQEIRMTPKTDAKK